MRQFLTSGPAGAPGGQLPGATYPTGIAGRGHAHPGPSMRWILFCRHRMICRAPGRLSSGAPTFMSFGVVAGCSLVGPQPIPPRIVRSNRLDAYG